MLFKVTGRAMIRSNTTSPRSVDISETVEAIDSIQAPVVAAIQICGRLEYAEWLEYPEVEVVPADEVK